MTTTKTELIQAAKLSNAEGPPQIAIPYDSLNISDDGRKIMLAGASKEAVRQLPEYKK